MPTTKYRINVSMPADVEKHLISLAKRDAVPCATKALELIKLAMEIEGDAVWNKLAATRDTKNAKFVSHKNAWK